MVPIFKRTFIDELTCDVNARQLTGTAVTIMRTPQDLFRTSALNYCFTTLSNHFYRSTIRQSFEEAHCTFEIRQPQTKRLAGTPDQHSAVL